MSLVTSQGRQTSRQRYWWGSCHAPPTEFQADAWLLLKDPSFIPPISLVGFVPLTISPDMRAKALLPSIPSLRGNLSRFLSTYFSILISFRNQVFFPAKFDIFSPAGFVHGQTFGVPFPLFERTAYNDSWISTLCHACPWIPQGHRGGGIN